MRSLLLGLGLASVMSAFGCSSSDDGGSASVSLEQACTDYAATICDKLSSCAPLFLVSSTGDAATCNARYKADCITTGNAPSTGVTGNSLAACVAGVKSTSCSDLLDNKVPAVCNSTPGGLADGQACGDDGQCKSTFCAFDEGAKVCGVCAPVPAAGAACADGSKCGPGFKCSTSKKCAVTVAAGGACDDDKPCTAGTTCKAGVCAVGLGEGAECGGTGMADCDALKGLVCLTNKCLKVDFAAAGAACGAEVDMATKKITKFTACEKSGKCNTATGSFTGTCAAAAADGAACGGMNAGCIFPAVCVDSVCKVPNPASCK